MTSMFRRGAHAAPSFAPPLATAGAALLSLDNLLGFGDAHVLHHGWSTGIAVVAVALALLGALVSSWCRDTVRSLVSCSVVVDVAVLSPTGVIAGWAPFSLVAQALVPLGLGAAAVLSWRRSRRTAHRALAALTAGSAAAWFVGAFVPVMSLEFFLGTQTLALIMAAALAARGVPRRATTLMRHLWQTADVR